MTIRLFCVICLLWPTVAATGAPKKQTQDAYYKTCAAVVSKAQQCKLAQRLGLKPMRCVQLAWSLSAGRQIEPLFKRWLADRGCGVITKQSAHLPHTYRRLITEGRLVELGIVLKSWAFYRNQLQHPDRLEQLIGYQNVGRDDLKDMWGQPFYYKKGRSFGRTPLLCSRGPDLRAKTGDDICYHRIVLKIR